MAATSMSGMIEDIHICGACREEFHDVELFIVHKRTGCPQLAKRLQSQNQVSLHNTQAAPSQGQLQQSPLGQVVLTRLPSQPQQGLVLQAPPNIVTPVLPVSSQEAASVASTQSVHFVQSHGITSQNITMLQASQIQHHHHAVQQAQPVEIVPCGANQTAANQQQALVTEQKSTGVTVSQANEPQGQQIQTPTPQQQMAHQPEKAHEDSKDGIAVTTQHVSTQDIAETMKAMQEQTSIQGTIHNVSADNQVQQEKTVGEVTTAMTPVNLSQNGLLIAGESGAGISVHQPIVATTVTETMSTQAQMEAGAAQNLLTGHIDATGQTTVINQAPQITLDLASLIGGHIQTSDGNPVTVQANTATEQNTVDTANNAAAGTVPSGTIQINLSPGANNLSMLAQNLPATLQAALQAGLGQILSQAPAGQPQPEETPAPVEKSPPKVGTTATPGTSPAKKARYETYNVPAQRPMVIVPTPKKYQCDYEGCGYSTSYQKDLERHQRIHTGEKPYECSQCGKAYNRSDKLRIHERNHSGVKPYKCPHCEYSTSDSSSLKKHLRIHTDERPFRCQICPYASRNSSQLIVHLRTHTGDCPFVCHVCNAKFKINSDLKRHMRLHTGEKPYKCDLCDYKCAIKGNLKSHYRINHSQENMVTCKDCGFQTSSRKAYREHMKTHEPNYHFSCQYCPYTCVSRATLRTHLRIHSEEKPYRCEFCNYATKQSGNVKMHMKRKHPGKYSAKLGGKVKDKDPLGRADPRPGEVPTASPIKSPTAVAGGSSPDQQGDEAGNKRASNIRPVCKKMFKCPQCDLSFVREDSLRCHLRCHKETDTVIAQAVENAAFAVLQLQHPISNTPRKEGEDGLTDHSYQGRMEGGGQEERAHHGEQNPRPAQQDGSQILQTALTQSDITPITLQQPQQLNQPHQDTNPPSTQAPTQQQMAQAPAPSHDESQAMLNQAASNLMAFMQNNQNMAVEDNIQNHAISRQQMAQTRQAEVPYSTHTINHHPTPRINEHHYANQQSLHNPQQPGQQRYAEPQPPHQGMGRPINLSVVPNSVSAVNVQIMGSNPAISSQAPLATHTVATSQPIQFIVPIPGSVPMTNNGAPMETVSSMPQGLVLNVDGQRGGYTQPRPPSYGQQTYTPTITHAGGHLQELPPAIATVDFSSLASPQPQRQDKGLEKKHGGTD